MLFSRPFWWGGFFCFFVPGGPPPDEALADAMFLDVTGRTAKRLLQIAGDDDEFSLPVTQEELAAMVGASRERVNKAIATFVRLGWVSLPARTRYRILNREELEARTRV